MVRQNKLSRAQCIRWMNPILVALKQLGGEAIVKDIYKVIAINEHLTNQEISETRGKTGIIKYKNNIQFARTYLKYMGYLAPSERGVWKLSKLGWNVEMTDELASNIFKRASVEFFYNSYYKWIDFYKIFSFKLLKYKNKRIELINKIKKVYHNSNSCLPYFLKKGDLNDIDPFTVFALFNSKNGNRSQIIGNINSIFEIGISKVPTDFDGIPTENNDAFIANMKLDYKYDKIHIDYLWELFECSMKYSKFKDENTKKELIDQYNNVQKMYKKKTLLTIGLHWIRPNNYIALTDDIYDFISNINEMYRPVSKLISSIYKPDFDGSKYIELCLELDKELFDGTYKYRSFAQLDYYIFNNKQV